MTCPHSHHRCRYDNILNTPPFKDDELAGHIMEAFSRAWSSIKEGPRFQSVAYPALLLLIQAKKTLPELYLLLEDVGYRLNLINAEENRTYVKKFLDEYKLWHETQANNNESVINKLTFQVFNSSVNRCMKTQENRINATEIMDKGKVLIVSLRGLSDPIQRMFGNLITVLFEQAALAWLGFCRAAVNATFEHTFFTKPLAKFTLTLKQHLIM